MILQKSYSYADMLLKKHFLLSMLKTAVPINISLENYTFFLDLMNIMFKRTAFI